MTRSSMGLGFILFQLDSLVSSFTIDQSTLICSSRASPPQIHTMCEGVKTKASLSERKTIFELSACLTRALKPSCPVLTGWHHHLLISSRSFHRLMDKATGPAKWLTEGPGVCCSAAKAVFTRCCLWAAPHRKPAWPFWSQHKRKGTKYGDKEADGGRREARWAVCGPRGGKGPGIWLITGGVRGQGRCPGSGTW